MGLADLEAVNYTQAKSTLTTALNRLIEAEPDVTRYDTIVGDGDCGIGLKRGAEGRVWSRVHCCLMLTSYSNPEDARNGKGDG